jgi:hypothetical protein
MGEDLGGGVGKDAAVAQGVVNERVYRYLPL